MADILELTDEHAEYLRDESRSVGAAESISFPRSEDEVRAVLLELSGRARAASVPPAPVTVQGARTGLAAGAVPSRGHVMNLSRMKRCLGLRRDDAGRFHLRVEPGLVLSELRKYLARRDIPAAGWDEASLAALAELKRGPKLFFPTDPTEASACLGGMAACNASGARSYRYGPMRPHVDALRVVLADGDVLALRRGEVHARGRHLDLATEGGRAIALDLPTYRMPATKNASGYFIEDDMDAVDLFIGSDGTLGVITELELALMEVPACVWGVSCFFPDERAALDFTVAARPELGCATALEYFDDDALAILRSQRAGSAAFASLPEVPARYAACVFVELACADRREAAAQLDAVGRLMGRVGADERDAWVARTDADRERQRFFRHAVPESVNMLIDERRRADPAIVKLGSDMSVPDEHLHEVVALYRRTLAEAGLQSAAWGHVGNNHLHVNILPRDAADYAAGKALFARWAADITAMGGAVSAEHGVGKLKRDFLAVMYGEDHIREMAALKRALDPEMRLGLGNLFPEGVLDSPHGGDVPVEAPEPAPRPLRALACVKAVPGSTEVRMDPATNTIVRDGGSSVMNPFDAAALEVALRLARDGGARGTVTAISMGIPATESMLRDCIARGATDALLLTDRAFAGADTLATTYALACGAHAAGGGFDLVVCGKMAVDGDTAQIGPELAGALGMPCVTDVREVLGLEDGRLRLRRGVEEGLAEVEVDLPALITVAREAAQLRMPSIAGARAAEGADVRVLSAADAGADPGRCGLSGSPTQVARSFVPERAGTAVELAGGAAEQAAAMLEAIEGMGL